MTPVIFIINLFSRGVMRLMRVDPDAASKVHDRGGASYYRGRQP